jgi:hypothetical protein
MMGPPQVMFPFGPAHAQALHVAADAARPPCPSNAGVIAKPSPHAGG